MDRIHLIPYSKEWRELNNLPTLEHELFFDLLFVSPSYQLVSAIERGDAAQLKSDQNLPRFNEVLDLYKIIGDISEITFDEWWQKKGQYLFYEKKEVESLNLSLDLRKEKKVLLSEVSDLIDQEKQRTAQSIKIKFIKNKVRVSTLSSRINLIFDLAGKRRLNPSFEYWRLAIFSGMKSNFAKGMKIDAKKTPTNLKARENLTEQVSRALSDTLFFSENAARGIFPSNKAIKTGLKFDLSFIDTYGRKKIKRETLERRLLHKSGKQSLTESQWKNYRKYANKKSK